MAEKSIYEKAVDLIDKLEYTADFTLRDIVAVDNYRTENTISITIEGQPAKVEKISELDFAIFGLGLGLTSLGGEKVTADNLEDLLLKHCENPLGIKLLYYRMYVDALKKK
jgi:hypothetical protein